VGVVVIFLWKSFYSPDGLVNQMLNVSNARGEPAIYRTFLRNRFTFREVVVSPTPLTAMLEGRINFNDPNFVDGQDVLRLEAQGLVDASPIR
jgi:hypothetical protein